MLNVLSISLSLCTQGVTPGGKARHSLGALHEAEEGEGEEGEGEEYDELLEQENRDVDMAIRESEKERDVIQVFMSWC